MVEFSKDVKAAIDGGQAVVALESTIIAHGMAYPHNLEMARAVETEVREGGAVPATIAIIDGKMRAGLSADELENFAKNGTEIPKVSNRDMAYVMAKRGVGATTVATTMRIAKEAGIAIFATGGMGGVHREADKTFDISNDLIEFAQSNVAVVTAGAKAILDLSLTLEYLETHGVPVVGYGTKEFPAFYSRTSGHALEMSLDTPEEVAQLCKVKWSAGLNGGIVVANPIPAKFEIPATEIEPVIRQALIEAKVKHIAGKATTPFLLKRIAEITGGRSLAANIALVMNNAKVASEIAVAYAKL